MKFILLLILWAILLINGAHLYAQQRLKVSYVTNGQFTAYSLNGFSMSYERKLTPKFSLGATAKYWKYVVKPYDENLQGLAINLHQYPLMSVMHYQLSHRAWQPYLGLETGLLINSFKSINGTPIQTKLSYGVLPKVGIGWVKNRVGIFVEASYFLQSSYSVEIGRNSSIPFKSRLPLFQSGVSFNWP